MGDQAELAELRARVSALEAERDELLYATSHDLAAPLRTLTGFLGLLGRRIELAEAEREMLGFVVAGADHLKVLLDGILRVSRVGTAVMAPGPLALDTVAAEAIAAAAPQAAGATVVVEGSRRMAHADRALLRLALVELVTNAAAAGATTIAIRGDEGGLTVWVDDDGPGIPADRHAKALALLGKLQSWEERPTAGAGLTVARRVAERHGGTLTLAGGPSGGLSVALALPEAP